MNASAWLAQRAGKSTLLKILGKEIPLDDGRIIYEQDLIVARLQQDPPRNIGGTVFDFVAEAWPSRRNT
ncbi:ABC transporter ATPase component [Serratia fonticola]|uniref:ABC transporter ATPase component n=1 Tax=Serratia fonticola TaxID=47917 RepID=A0A4U9V0I2_SERFO|nr:ABC transporter ATPase component [Serratia fonticola]